MQLPRDRDQLWPAFTFRIGLATLTLAPAGAGHGRASPLPKGSDHIQKLPLDAVKNSESYYATLAKARIGRASRAFVTRA